MSGSTGEFTFTEPEDSTTNISNNVILNTQHAGIYCNNTRKLDISNNILNNTSISSGTSLTVLQTATWKTSVNINYNNIKSGRGCTLSYMDNLVFSGNSIIDCTGSGVNISNTDFINVCSNRISTTTAHGFSITNTVLDGIITGNSVNNVGSLGYNISSQFMIDNTNLFSGTGTGWTDYGKVRVLSNVENPSVRYGNVFFLTGTTTIKGFTDSNVAGHMITIYVKSTVVIKNGDITYGNSSRIMTKSGTDLSLVSGNIVQFVKRSSSEYWSQI